MTLLHFSQMLSVMFIYHIFTCTCKTEIVSKTMLSCFKDIGWIAGVTIVISAVESSAIAILTKIESDSEVTGYMSTFPLYIVSTLLETVAIMYFAYFVLRSLDESRRFREQNGANPDYKLRNLMILVVAVPILFLLRLVALASATVLAVVFLLQGYDISECLRQHLQNVLTELYTNIDLNVKNICMPQIFIIDNLLYLTRYFNHTEFLLLLSQQLYNKFMR